MGHEGAGSHERFSRRELLRMAGVVALAAGMPGAEHAEAAEGKKSGRLSALLREQLKNRNIDLSPETRERVIAYWEKRYAKGGDMHADLVTGMERLRPHEAALRAAWGAHKIPLRHLYALLAIESRFGSSDSLHENAVSARGPFQFTRAQAELMGLALDPDDERLDWVKAGAAAATLLRENTHPFRHLFDGKNDGEGWALALLSYNGTYAWRTIAGGWQGKRKITLGDYFDGMADMLRKSAGILPEKALPTEESDYVIVKGDSLLKIAARFGVSLADLTAANPTAAWVKNPNLIVPGTKIAIPKSPERVPRLVTKPGEYVVRRKDTLSRIAQKFKVDVGELRRANNLKDDLIIVGQKLALPADARQEPKESASLPQLSEEQRRYKENIEYILKIQAFWRAFPDLGR